MAALILAVVALLPALAQAQVATSLAGGASSARDLMRAAGGLYASCGLSVSTAVTTPTSDYASVGSGLGIDNFISGQYAIGVSDAPMSAVDEQKVNGNGRATIPLVLSRYSFYINTAKVGGGTVAKVKLTAPLSLLIYRGKYASWAKVGAAYATIASTTITRFARGEPTGSGTTQIIKQYWYKGAKALYVPTGGALTTDVLPAATFPGLALRNGTSNMCLGVFQTTGGICYAQVGICDSLAATSGGGVKLNEALLQNKANKYVLASTADAAASAPRQIPLFTASWSAIPDRMILQTGPKTNAISSFVYAFVRLKNSALGGAKAVAAKGVLTCWLTKQATVANAFFFTPLPAPIKAAAAKFVLTLS